MTVGSQLPPAACHGANRKARGPSSFWMQDPSLVFNKLNISPGDCFVDLGCGPGDYTLEASRATGPTGIVYAFDKAAERVEDLQWLSLSPRMGNIRAMTADITEPLPLRENFADICLIANVLHIPAVTESLSALAQEIHRILKPDGHLAIIECKKEEMPCGPPLHMRLSPEDIDATLPFLGFQQTGFADLGYNYMVQYKKK